MAPTGPGAGAGSENVLIARRMIVRMKESARGKKENADIKENASGKMENAKLNVLKPPQLLLFNQVIIFSIFRFNHNSTLRKLKLGLT